MKTKDIKQNCAYVGRDGSMRRVITICENGYLNWLPFDNRRPRGRNIGRCRIRTFANWAQKSAW